MPISDDVVLGEGVVIPHPELVNLYGCEIGAGTKIASFVEIQRGVKIGKNCKIEAGAFICMGVTLEDGVFIGPYVTFTNDKYPRAVAADGSLLSAAQWTITPTLVKFRAAIGANSTIVCGVTLGEHCMIGSGSVIRKNVGPRELWAGNPAIKIRAFRDGE
jgi:UDP-2-acetamido-3-amino-2,3-dideoxy-glucuronate N-acetyltransferase